jgi:FAD/FMN-containing dehydrogenase
MKDRQSLLSYSWDGNVMTIDPVSTANPGWKDFLVAYNQYCSDNGGIPLLNQTPMVTRAQLEKGLGDRWKQYVAARKTFDPNNRLLNDYFTSLLG